MINVSAQNDHFFPYVTSVLLKIEEYQRKAESETKQDPVVSWARKPFWVSHFSCVGKSL